MHEIVYQNFASGKVLKIKRSLVMVWTLLVLIWLTFGGIFWMINDKNLWLIFTGLTIWILWTGLSISKGLLRYGISKIVLNKYPLTFDEAVDVKLIHKNCQKYTKKKHITWI